MMIPLGSSGGRQLTSTEEESSALSCSSSGGVEGPGGEQRTGSVISTQKLGLTAGECILFWWGIWHVVQQPSASSCSHHLGTGERGQAGQWGNGLGLRWWYMVGESLPGWLVVMMSLKASRSTLTTLTWLADRAAGWHETYYHTWVFYYSQLSVVDATANSHVHWPLASRHADLHERAHTHLREQAITPPTLKCVYYSIWRLQKAKTGHLYFTSWRPRLPQLHKTAIISLSSAAH